MTEDHISSLENHPDMQLKFVQVIFRHGARTPLSEIKNLEPVSLCPSVKAGIDFTTGPPVPTGKILGGPASFVMRRSSGSVGFWDIHKV